jgi:hypothetical protein
MQNANIKSPRMTKVGNLLPKTDDGEFRLAISSMLMKDMFRDNVTVSIAPVMSFEASFKSNQGGQCCQNSQMS